jgi:glycosyltransferase involved in cell wall biosynthesis
MAFNDKFGWNLNELTDICKIRDGLVFFEGVARSKSNVDLVPDNELNALYNIADVVMLISGEGFGLPIVEAMACGCPVLLSNASSFPEVAKNAGVFFNINQPDSLIDALQKITFDQEFRTEILNQTEAHVKTFSWQKTAAAFLKIYESAV